MKLNFNQFARKVGKCAAWTLTEVLLAALVMTLCFGSLYLGLGQGFNIIDQTRDSLRATQILGEKMETIRLYTWDQLNTPGFVPTSFTNYFFPSALTNNSRGIAYTGTLSITTAPVTETYSNDLKKVVATVTWTSGRVTEQRDMTTFVSHYGMQNYIYGPQ